MTLRNIIEFRDWLFDFTAKMKNDYVLGEQEVLFFVKDKFSSLGLNDNKIDKEPIDEEKLNKLAQIETDNYETQVIKTQKRCNCESIIFYNRGFKAGYRKAMEDMQ